MIGAEYQGKGHGRSALSTFIETEREAKKHKTLKLSYVPENIAAKTLYAKLGFVETGLREGGEMGAELKL